MEKNETQTLIFAFYGIGVSVTGPGVLLEKIRRDFSYFQQRDGGVDAVMSIAVEETEPPYERVPQVRAVLYQPDSLAYDEGDTRYVDYNGRALCVYDYVRERGVLYSRDEELLHELAYLLIHSRVGELLDKKGLHRVHALGISYGGKGAVCLLPQGGGKTTLCLALLRDPDIMLMSDDTPLIARSGILHAFPVRIGIGTADTRDIPDQFLSIMVRRKYGTKTLVDTAYYAGRIAAQAPLAFVLIGEREFSDRPRIVPVSRFVAVAAMFRNCVVGLGLPQVVEYFLRYRMGDIAGKFVVFLSRVVASLRVVLTAKSYRFTMGRDPEANASLVLQFMKNDGKNALRKK
jgi:hypothetical protein